MNVVSNIIIRRISYHVRLKSIRSHLRVICGLNGTLLVCFDICKKALKTYYFKFLTTQKMI